MNNKNGFRKTKFEVTNDDLTTAHPSSNKDHYNTNDSEIREGINNYQDTNTTLSNHENEQGFTSHNIQRSEEDNYSQVQKTYLMIWRTITF